MSTLGLHEVSLDVDGQPWLRNINLAFDAGDVGVLLGRTGAGKTSLLRIAAGLAAPTQGRVEFAGMDVTGLSVRRRSVAMVYQAFINYPHLSVFDNIASPLVVAGCSRQETRRRVVALAERLGIDGLLDARPDALSGGQQQRTAIARALVKDAELILFDEPLANLDFKLRESLRGDIREWVQESGSVALYATTEPQEALVMGGSVTVMDEGQVLQQGPVTAVYREPQSVRCAELMSEPPMNVLSGVCEGASVSVGSVRVAIATPHLVDPPAGPCQVGVRPTDIVSQRGAPGDIAIDVNVDLAEIGGAETYLHLSSEAGPLVAEWVGIHPLAADSRLTVYLPQPRLFLFGVDGELQRAPPGLRATT